jgi:hypothetical protein
MAADSLVPFWLRRARLLSRGCVLVLSASAIAAITIAHVRFDPPSLAALGILAVVVLVALPGAPPARWAVSAAAAISLFALVRFPPLYHVEPGPLLAPGIALGWIAIIAVGILPWFRAAQPRYTFTVLAIIAVAYGLVVLGGRPIIDVWFILRDAANGLLVGQNPYTMMFPDVPAGQTDNCFNYLPATFLLTAPAQWVLGDVRWLTAAYLFIATALIAVEASHGASSGKPARIAAGLLIGVMPGTLTLVQQSWNEPILLCGLVAGAVLIRRGRPNLAIVPFALALACKQHTVIFLPLMAIWPAFGWRRAIGVAALAAAICAPWLIANPARFYGCTAAFFLDAPAIARSQSLWQILPEMLRLPVLIIAATMAYATVLWRVPRTAGGLLLGCGTVLLAFDLFNKQTFFNQWLLAAELLTAGTALSASAEDTIVAKPVGLHGP